MAIEQGERRNLRSLRDILAHAKRRGLHNLKEDELRQLPRLYRHACTVLAGLETQGERGRAVLQLRKLVSQAHGLLYRNAGDFGTGASGLARLWPVRAWRFVLHESPRAIRQEWKLVASFMLLFYGMSLAAYFGVSRDLELAYSLFSPEMVDHEIEQLRETPADEAFRGNFNFGLGESPKASSFIMFHNMGVGVLFFASGLLTPLLFYLLGNNALMLGTYTGVASHWGQGGAISSILWCHGVLELQALVLSGVAGLILIRAWIAPGPWSRRQAMTIESRQAWRIMAPLFPLLFVAGLIEGFVSPHAPFGVRISVAIGTGALLVLWVALGGRRGVAGR